MLTSKCNLKLINKGLTNTKARHILCQILSNHVKRLDTKVSEKGITVLVKKLIKLYTEKAKEYKYMARIM